MSDEKRCVMGLFGRRDKAGWTRYRISDLMPRASLVGDDHIAAGIALDLGGDVRAQYPSEQAVVVRADDDQLGSPIPGSADDRIGQAHRRPTRTLP